MPAAHMRRRSTGRCAFRCSVMFLKRYLPAYVSKPAPVSRSSSTQSIWADSCVSGSDTDDQSEPARFLFAPRVDLVGVLEEPQEFRSASVGEHRGSVGVPADVFASDRPFVERRDERARLVRVEAKLGEAELYLVHRGWFLAGGFPDSAGKRACAVFGCYVRPDQDAVSAE